MPSFHLSIQVKFYEETKSFYKTLFNANLDDIEGRYSNIDVFGQQLTIHKNPSFNIQPFTDVHFGFNISNNEFDQLYKQAKSAKASFILEPQDQISSSGKKRRKMIIKDPNGYQIEMKAFH